MLHAQFDSSPVQVTRRDPLPMLSRGYWERAVVLLIYHWCNSADLSSVTVLETGKLIQEALPGPLGTAHVSDALPTNTACETKAMPLAM